MTFALGPTSLKKLEGVDPVLVSVVKRAIEITTQDFSVLWGVRTLKEQAALYAQGRTVPGNIVTWTMDSKHLPGANGFGRAVDLLPYPADWKEQRKFRLIAVAMMQAAKEQGVRLRWGADWNMNQKEGEKGETDFAHFELV
jgi:peptidoglycan L-alanyl-D-glutamate endopeptidase CwlK